MNSQEIANDPKRVVQVGVGSACHGKGEVREGGRELRGLGFAAKEGEVLEMKGGERKKGAGGKRADYYLFFLNSYLASSTHVLCKKQKHWFVVVARPYVPVARGMGRRGSRRGERIRRVDDECAGCRRHAQRPE